MTSLERLQRAKADIETVLNSLGRRNQPETSFGEGQLASVLLVLDDATDLLDNLDVLDLEEDKKAENG